eukprot:6849415-Karenia_brevis.AAC.1
MQDYVVEVQKAITLAQSYYEEQEQLAKSAGLLGKASSSASRDEQGSEARPMKDLTGAASHWDIKDLNEFLFQQTKISTVAEFQKLEAENAISFVSKIPSDIRDMVDEFSKVDLKKKKEVVQQ